MVSLKSCSGCLSSGLTGVIGVKILLVFETSVWFTLHPGMEVQAVSLNFSLCRKFA